MQDDNAIPDEFVLDDVSFAPDVGRLAQRLHVKAGSQDAADLQRLVGAAQHVARPKALYRLVYVEGRGEETVTLSGVTFTSRVLRVNLASAHRAFAYIATCGMELERWAQEIDDMLHNYWAEAIKEVALRAATRALNRHLEDCYQPGRTATMNPGSLEDWPLRQQRPLFALFRDPEAAIGVRLTDSFLMVPNKTVSGLRFPTEESFESCQLCPRASCPGRRAAYDPTLFERKYQRQRSSLGGTQ